MTNKLPEYLLEKFQLMGTVTFTVLFAIIFLNLYTPFSTTVWFNLDGSFNFIFTAGFLAISILFVIISKIIVYKLKSHIRISYLNYILWCIGETAIISLLYTYISTDILDYTEMSRIRVYLKAQFISTVCIMIPYILSSMYFAIIEKNNTIKLMRFTTAQVDDNTEEIKEEESHISLFDNSGVLKLSIKSSNLYYIESDDNYIKVWYESSSGELKMYMLRCRLKTIEESFKESSLVRCHRKYIVNKDKIKVLRKEGDKYFIDLDFEGISPIVITKTYQKAFIEAFTGLPINDSDNENLPSSPTA